MMTAAYILLFVAALLGTWSLMDITRPQNYPTAYDTTPSEQRTGFIVVVVLFTSSFSLFVAALIRG